MVKICGKKCFEDYNFDTIKNSEQDCLDNCIKLYMKTQEIANKIYTEESLKIKTN